jgi:phage tail sheath protein FI
VKEIDQTSYIPAVSTTIGATAGVFEWGPAHKIVNIDNENSLIRVFGRPTESNYVDWYSAANYLGYSNYLKVVRVVDSAESKNAASIGAGVYIPNEDVFEASPTTWESTKFAARYPGTLGNSLLVSVVDNAGFAAWEYKSAFTSSTKSKTSTKNVNFSRTGSLTLDSNTIVLDSTANIVVGQSVFDGDAESVFVDSASITTGSPTVSGIIVPSTVLVGQKVFGDGIPDNTTVSSKTSNTITLSANATTTKKSDLWFFNDAGATAIPASAVVTSVLNSTTITIDKVATSTVASTKVFFHELRTITTFPGQPDTSDFAKLEGGDNDELHVVVVDVNGKFTGTKGTVLEKFTALSKATDGVDNNGNPSFFADVINNSSRYVYVSDKNVFGTSSSLATTSFGDLSRSFVVSNTSGSAVVTISNVTTDVLRPGMAIAGTGVAAGSVILSITNSTTFVLSKVTTSNVSAITATGTAHVFTFSGGADGYTAITDADRITNGFAKFKHQEEVDVNLVFAGNTTESIADYLIDEIGEYRKDCMVFVSPPKSAVVENVSPLDAVKDFRNVINSSSYAVLDSGWKMQYDAFNDKYRWIPLNPDTAGLVAQTERTNDAWWSPAGFNRGYIKNVVKLAYNPSAKGDRDELYQVGINPVVTFPGQGTILYGDKTLLARPSAFDHINVRRLFIVLEKAIATYSKFVLFEFNDAQTRSRFTNTIVPYLRNIQGRRGIIDFKVIADETVNTPDVIDGNSFAANILIKPNKSINFIQLNFVAVNTGASFEEVAL